MGLWKASRVYRFAIPQAAYHESIKGDFSSFIDFVNAIGGGIERANSIINGVLGVMLAYQKGSDVQGKEGLG